jgi:hypothetical protein
MSKSPFMLRLPEDERTRAKKVADDLGLSENRLYAELIHDGLLMHEQMHYMKHLRQLSATVSKEDALSILDRVPATPPAREDALDASGHH